MGNRNHEPAGSPKGGQFAHSGCGICVSDIKNAQDLEQHVQNILTINRTVLQLKTQMEDAKKEHDREKTKKLKAERIALEESKGREIRNALYESGYICDRNQKLWNTQEAEEFLKDITNEHAAQAPWVNHKDMVENYVRVFKGFLASNRFDFVLNGHRSSDGSFRRTDELTSEFGINDEQEIKKLLQDNLSADDFVQSGKNDSHYVENQGTVVMVFAPTVILTKRNELNEDVTEEVNLYVKLVLNPHPNKDRDQSNMQILSVREANNKVCMFTGKLKSKR